MPLYTYLLGWAFIFRKCFCFPGGFPFSPHLELLEIKLRVSITDLDPQPWKSLLSTEHQPAWVAVAWVYCWWWVLWQPWALYDPALLLPLWTQLTDDPHLYKCPHFTRSYLIFLNRCCEVLMGLSASSTHRWNTLTQWKAWTSHIWSQQSLLLHPLSLSDFRAHDLGFRKIPTVIRSE